MAEKTEKPTQKKLNDAKKKGQVVLSQEIVVGFQMVAVLGYFLMEGPAMMSGFKNLIELTIATSSYPFYQAVDMFVAAFKSLFWRLTIGMSIVFIVTLIMSCVGQTGPVFASESLEPKLDKLNVVNNAKNIFSMKSLFDLCKNILKTLILGMVFYYLISEHADMFQYLPACGVQCGLNVTFTFMKWLLGAFIACYVLFAIADYAFMYHNTMKDLKMSKEDTKQEHKESEGDPQIKGKRKELAREINSGATKSNVKKSTVVIRNPTHLAICLYYDADVTPLPQVLEKSADHMALHVVGLANKYQVPVVENVPLARALYKQVETGQYIPESLFEPVAELLRIIMNLSYDLETNREDVKTHQTDKN